MRISPYTRVRLSAGKLALAGAADLDCIGVALIAAFADGDVITVATRGAPGTMMCQAAAPFAAGATVYAAAAGRIDDSGTVLVGLALDEATAQGDWIEFIPTPASQIGSIASSALTQNNSQPYVIPLTGLREKTDLTTVLPATPAATNMGIVDNTYLSGAADVETIDQKAKNASAYARFQFPVPPEYVAGQGIVLKVNAGMKTTVSDTTATLDASAVRPGAPTVNLVSTNPQSINSLTAADFTFTITPTSVVPGDILDVLLTIAIHERRDRDRRHRQDQQNQPAALDARVATNRALGPKT